MNKQQLNIQIKSIAEDGTFEGLLSPYGNVDNGGDVVDAGAFAKTLKERGNTVPMLWQHDQKCPIGSLTLDDRADGLYCMGKFVLEIPEAKQAYLLLKANVIKGLSIGYAAIKAATVEGIRHLKEIRLFEGSIVTFPMNDMATVSSVKSMEMKGDFDEELADIQIRATERQCMDALYSALCGICWSGLTRDEIMETADAVIDQFKAAYTAWIPTYLDYLEREYGIDTKSWAGQREVKEGRKLSKSTKSTITDAHKYLTDATQILSALLEEEADDDASDVDTSSGDGAAETKSEPVNHSAATLLSSMRALLQ